MGGGVTPVHTTLVPDISTIVRNGLQENMNPSLNAIRGTSAGNGIGSNRTIGGFDGFADLNPFTMKTLDAYVSFVSFYDLYHLFLETVIACTSGEKWLLNSKRTMKIMHYRIIRTLQAWRPIYVLTSSLPHPSPTRHLHQDMEVRSLHCFRESTMFPIQILPQPCRPRLALHYQRLLRCRRLRKNNSMLCWQPWLAKPSSTNWAMRFGMPLLDLPHSPPLPRLVVIGTLIKYVKFWKAKLCCVLSMWNLLLFRLLLRRYQVHLLHHLHHRVSHRGLHWVNRDLHHRRHQICHVPQKMVVGCRVNVKRQCVTSWRRA